MLTAEPFPFLVLARLFVGTKAGLRAKNLFLRL